MNGKVSWWKSLFANYNPLIDKIDYCNEGSLQWLHENRHKQQFSIWYLKFAYEWGFFLGLILTVLLMNWIYSLPAFIITIIIELDAWQYSKRKRYFRGRKQG